MTTTSGPAGAAALEQGSVALNQRVAQRAESRMLVDGRAAPGRSGGTFGNVSPATGAVLGTTTAAAAEDMDAAIAAARRAFDETSWSTDRALRKRCLLQLQEALENERRRPARGARRRGRRADDDHLHGPTRLASLRCPDLSRRTDRHLHLGARTGPRHRLRRRQPAQSGQGARRSGRGDRAVELPDRDRAEQAGSGPGHGEHRGAQARSEYPVDVDAHRQADRRAHRHSRQASSTSCPPRTTRSPNVSSPTRGWTWCRSPDPPTSDVSSRAVAPTRSSGCSSNSVASRRW